MYDTRYICIYVYICHLYMYIDTHVRISCRWNVGSEQNIDLQFGIWFRVS